MQPRSPRRTGAWRAEYKVSKYKVQRPEPRHTDGVVFDGSPAQLTARVIQEIYGGDAESAVDESLTSTMGAIYAPAKPVVQPEMAGAI